MKEVSLWYEDNYIGLKRKNKTPHHTPFTITWLVVDFSDTHMLSKSRDSSYKRKKN